MRKNTALIRLYSVSAAAFAASAARFYCLSVSRDETCPCHWSAGIETVLQAFSFKTDQSIFNEGQRRSTVTGWLQNGPILSSCDYEAFMQGAQRTDGFRKDMQIAWNVPQITKRAKEKNKWNVFDWTTTSDRP